MRTETKHAHNIQEVILAMQKFKKDGAVFTFHTYDNDAGEWIIYGYFGMTTLCDPAQA